MKRKTQRKTLTIEEYAGLIGLQKGAVRRAIKAGIIPAIQIRKGSKYVIPIAAVAGNLGLLGIDPKKVFEVLRADEDEDENKE